MKKVQKARKSGMHTIHRIRQNQTGQAGIRELKTDTELELEMEGKHEVH